ncbi:MAG: hypothetical protein ABIH67_05255 [Candidatus Uhrbacteria bacterium]
MAIFKKFQVIDHNGNVVLDQDAGPLTDIEAIQTDKGVVVTRRDIFGLGEETTTVHQPQYGFGHHGQQTASPQRLTKKPESHKKKTPSKKEEGLYTALTAGCGCLSITVTFSAIVLILMIVLLVLGPLLICSGLLAML